jgi:MoxR-like ATPase
VPVDSIDAFQAGFDRLADNIDRVVRGKRDTTVRQALTCLFANGHLLIQDIPGVGKTRLARSLAASVAVRMSRIQFTPDLLPTDVTGTTVYTSDGRVDHFRAGPVFANVVLADELNRASPKTQSALLEVMAERQVTFEGKTYRMDDPFIVVATQNPVEQWGTYPLPEAQLDRFLMCVRMDYPDYAAEIQILRAEAAEDRLETLEPVLSGTDVTQMIKFARDHVRVGDRVHDYILQITHGTRALAGFGAGTRRELPLRLGASPRGSIALVRTARVRAAAAGRDFVTPDDVRELAVPVLAHRLIPAPEMRFDGVTTAEIVERVLEGAESPDRAHRRSG